MKKLVILFVILVSLLSYTHAGKVESVYHFDNPTAKNAGEYQTLNFENTLLSALPGQPALPYRQIKLMLPPGESAQSIEIVFSDEVTLAGKFNLFPQQQVRPVSEANSGILTKDEALYRSNSIYPSNPQGRLITAFLNGRSFALSTFTPVRYNPASGVLTYYKSARVIVHTAPDERAKKALDNFSAGSDQALRFADNSEMDQQYGATRKLLTDPYELLIVCSSAFSGNFENLRAAYLKEGLRSEVVTLEIITSTMTGIDDPEMIRNYIIQEYQAHGIQHVMLAGDAEIIPYRGLYGYVKSGGGYTDSAIPADIYYSAFDGNWNSDGDSKWGEPADTLAPFNPDEADLLPEISVGRLPFSNLEELNAMLHKSYSYQFTPVAGEFRDVLMAGEYLYPAPYYTQGSFYLELLIGPRTDYGYTTDGIPGNYDFDKMYDVTSAAAWSKQDLMNHLNAGSPMLNHVGHANYGTMMRMGTADITNTNFSGLDGINHNYTVAYTHGCNCGGFDVSDCIAERTVAIDNYAAAIITNTRYGWFNEGTSDGPSAHLHREFMDALFHDKINRIGSAHTESKRASASWVTAPGQWEQGALRWVFYDCTVLGDPAMAVFTDNPFTIQTSYPASISAGATSIPVSVASSGAGAEGLTCVVIENGVMLGKAITNVSGNATVSLSPAIGNPDNVQLVVSGYNCIPITYNLTARTYTWNVPSGNWNSSSNWSPARTSPAGNDILIFDGSVQANPAITLDFTSAENIGRVRIINNATVNIASASASRTINVGASGSAEPQFEIATGSVLNVNAANPVTINLPAGTVAGVSGNISFAHAAHRLTATDEGGIVFNNGSVFTAATDFTGNAFGMGTPNSVVFNEGSQYNHSGGGSPFALTQPASVVAFNPGSLYSFTSGIGAPDLSGRTYGNLLISSSSTGINSISGTGGVILHDLTVNTGNLGIDLSGAINLKGNVSLAAGTSLNLNPPVAATTTLNGTTLQLISGEGTFGCGSNSTILSSDSAGVRLAKAATFNNFTIASGTFTIASGASLITNGNVTGTAIVERNISNDNAWHFLSSPVSSQAIQPAFAPTFLNTTFDFYAWDPAQNLSTGLPWINIRNGETGLNTNFDPLHPSSPEFYAGCGYMVAYSPVYVNPGNTGSAKVFTGSLNSGNSTVHLTDGANPWNLAGNPYPSSVDFDLFSASAGNALVTPAYWTVLPDGTFASYLSGSGGINGASESIAPMQGFFVEAASTGDISFTNAMRTHSSQAWLKKEQSMPDQMKLKLTGENGTADELLIHRSEVFTGASGAEKLLIMNSESANLYTLKEDKKFCIDQIDDNTESCVLGLLTSASGNYTISVVSNSFQVSAAITLEDMKTGKIQDLQKNPVYCFSASPEDESSRFILHLKKTSSVQEEKENGIQINIEGRTLTVRQTDMLKGEIHIYNVAGQLVETGTLSPVATQKISLDYLETGIYMVTVLAGKSVVHAKILIP